MRTCIIVNPTAGRGTAPALARRVAALLGGAEFIVTCRPGEATRIAAASAGRGVEVVVAAGGDGTVAEVAAGLLSVSPPARPRLGILPLGTGNDLARGLGIPRRLAGAVRALEAGGHRPLDAVRLSPAAGSPGGETVARAGLPAPGAPVPGWMLNALVAGFCGGIGDRVDARLRRRWGPLAYLRAALLELGGLRARATRLTIDGGATLELESVMVVAANGRFAGGRLPLAPDARPDDGRVDVLVVPALPAPALLAEALRVLAGRQAGSRRLVRLRARVLDLALDPPSPCNVDGETVPGGPIRLEVVPGALRVVAPPA